MRKLIMLMMAAALASFPNVGYCAKAKNAAETVTQSSTQSTEAKAIADFENLVKVFENFFANKPRFLEKQNYSNSPSGSIYVWHRYDNCQIAYDIKKTESLVSPYSGIITVSYSDFETKTCGDFEVSIMKSKYFSTAENARKDKDNDSCYTTDLDRGTKFIFAFQKGIWVLKDVRLAYNDSTDRLRGLVSGDITIDNLPWKVLTAK